MKSSFRFIYYCLFSVIGLYVSVFQINEAKGQTISGLTPFQYGSVKQMHASKAAVVSAHPLASQAGALMLQKGGNAFDAAIATQWALAVVLPAAGNIGGGGFLVAAMANGNKYALDYREKAPGNATENMYIDKDGKANTEKSQNGHLASGIPGTVAGLFETHRYATLPMATLIVPAIQLAQEGFAITSDEANGLNRNKKAFITYNTKLPVFVKETLWKQGDTLVQKDLAKTLRNIQSLGAKGFYEGETAALLVAEMTRGGGIITLEDLKNYKAVWRKPVVFDYKGHEIISMPPPSSGGILLHQMLAMLSRFPLDKMGFHSPESVQLITEVERLAYADRAEFLGDPDFYKVPAETIISEKYITQRLSNYKKDTAGVSKNVDHGILPESEETTHLSVMDSYGNAVSVTTTLNGGYGSKTVVDGAGFLLNNEMDDFSVQPGVANMYGAIGGKANAIAPHKRMLSSMTPTIVMKSNKPFLIVGSPGGTTIITSVLQSIINIIDFKLSAYEAVNEPKFHHQWLPDELYLEKNFPVVTMEKLKKMGYIIKERGSIGRTDMILVNEDGTLDAVGDNRGDDSAAGW
jgi:gamma-glutamyltranspeptidase/glutathione hydrolase